MQVVGILPRAVYELPRTTLHREAEERVRWVRCWQTLRQQGLTSSAAAETLGLPRSTLYRWQRKLSEEGAVGLRTKSRRPHKVRGPTWSAELSQAVLELREQYPRWGKDKLGVLLRRQGWKVSTSMTGRILTSLKASGILKEPPRYGVPAAPRRVRSRPYAVRKPKDYQAREPGDIVQVDTLDVRPLPGVVLKHFTARDMVSRWDVIEAHPRATARKAAQFLTSMRRRFPFPIRAIQVDGGSEFRADFESACKESGIKLFVLPPRSPKLNGHVERAQRTHTEEFYEVYDGETEIVPLNRALLEWERVYDTYRPHQSLDGLTPAEYIEQCQPEVVSSPP